MTTKEAVALLERYSNYDGMGIPNLAGCKEAMRVAVDALKEACPELRESEDERIRKAIVGLIEELQRSDKYFAGVELTDMLAYLEKQKEQKPAEWDDYKDKVNVPYCSSEPEWSEEDEDMLNSCISSIEEAKENRYAYKETDGDTSYDHEIAWLKSLRPDSYKNCNSRWKPSEEQMKALEDAFRKDGSDKYRKTINSLYQQLKKL